MEGKEFYELYNEAGLKSFMIDGRFWVKFNNYFVQHIPSLENIKITKAEEFNVIFCTKSLLGSYIEEKSKNKNSIEYIYDGKSYDIELFNSKTRNQIKKGLKYCNVKRPSRQEMEYNALNINKMVMKKQKRKSFLEDQKSWVPYINYLYERNDVNIWGAYFHNNLIAYLIIIRTKGKVYIYHPFMNYNYSEYNPIMALLYNAVNEELKYKNIISYGLKSYKELNSLDHFKKNLLFKEVSVQRSIFVSNKIEFIFSNTIDSLVEYGKTIKIIPKQYSEAYSLLKSSR